MNYFWGKALCDSFSVLPYTPYIPSTLSPHERVTLLEISEVSGVWL